MWSEGEEECGVWYGSEGQCLEEDSVKYSSNECDTEQCDERKDEKGIRCVWGKPDGEW